jgi:hypothetical protein
MSKLLMLSRGDRGAFNEYFGSADVIAEKTIAM